MQVEPRLTVGLPRIDRTLCQRLKLNYDEPHSEFAFNFDLRRCSKNAPIWAAAVAAVTHPKLFSHAQLHAPAPTSADNVGVAAAGDASDAGGAAIEGVGAMLWFVRSAVKLGSKGGGSR